MHKNAGFTLIEIAIVLVIIGLLAGGVLKGQQMIENAKYKAWVKEIDALRTAIYAFQDRYRALPGDLRGASMKLPTVDNVSAISGNGNGFIEGGPSGESVHVIHHLVLAGLIKGDATCPDVVYCMPPVPIGGVVGDVMSGAWVNGKMTVKAGYYMIPARFAKRYDEEFDDGKATTGTVVCNPFAGGTFATLCTGNTNWPTDDQVVAVLVDM